MDDRKRPLPAISDHRILRYGMAFLLYFAQGVPAGLLHIAVAGWLAANNEDPAALSLFMTAAVAPLILKFVFGMAMDRFTFLPMGRRRAWILLAQLALVSSLFGLAWSDPDPFDIPVLAIGALAIMSASSLQSVAVDGMAIDLIPSEEQGRANSFMNAGYIFGYALAAGASGWAIGAFGLQATLLCAGAILTLVLLCVIGFRERRGERMLPWSTGTPSKEAQSTQLTAWTPLFGELRTAMFGSNILFCAGALFAQSFLAGLLLVAFPLIATQTANISAADFAALAGLSSLLAGVVSVIVYANIIDRVGAIRLGMLLFATAGCVAFGFGLIQTRWSSPWIVMSMLMFSETLGAGMFIALSATAMRLSTASIAATQFALLMALTSLGSAIGTSLFTPVYNQFAYTGVFLAITASAFIGAAALWYLFQRSEREAGAASSAAPPSV